MVRATDQQNGLKQAMETVDEQMVLGKLGLSSNEAKPDIDLDDQTFMSAAAVDDFAMSPIPPAPAMPKAEQKDLIGRNRVIGLKNANGEVGVNPKDKIGAAKVDLTLIPPAAEIHMALALMDGATKYGPYNWRVEPIQARTYIAAIKRHCMDYLDGEDCADDSGIKHLGHIMACAAILVDAQHQGTLIDDRPIVNSNSAGAPMLLEVAHKWIKETKSSGWGR